VLGPLPLVLWLTVVWTGLWGSVTWANVLGGLAVSLALVLLLPLAAVPGRPVLAPVALLRFAGHFVVDLFLSSWQVAILAVRLRAPLRQAVVAVPVRGASDGLLTLLADAISLTPGTLTLEVDRPRSTLYVHVLDVGPGTRSVDAVRQSILQVERLAVLAIGSDEARRALAEDEGRVRR
jgi:multicomponent Na+:H+ antiporter subunit E